MKNISNLIILIIIMLFGFYTVKDLFSPGFFPMHDDTQPARVQQMVKSLSDGLIPVRWVADLGYGYGYPIFNFYAPFAYYFGSIFFLTGLELLTSTKIMMGFGMVFSGISMYFLAKELWGKLGGLISSLLYLYAPYHALNLYVRGDVAEMYAYSFLPLVFLAVLKLFEAKKDVKSDKENNHSKFLNFLISNWKWIALGSLSYAAVITSHNLTALMLTLFLAIFISVNWFLDKNRKISNLKYILFTLALSVLISAFYWLPVIGEMQYTNVLSQVGGKADYNLHFVCLNQIWDSPWGFGGSTPGCVDGMSFKLGKIHVLLTLASFMFLYINKSKNKKTFTIITSLILMFIISIYVMLDSSKIVWDFLPFMKFFQYPWRFMIMATFTSSLLGGFLISNVNYFSSNNKIIQIFKFASSTLLIIAIFLLYAKLFVPQTVNGKTAADYTSEFNLKWTISKISDEYLPGNFSKPETKDEIVKEKFEIIKGSAQISNEVFTINKIYADISANTESEVLIKIAYFPAWNLYLNNSKHDFKISDKGIMTVIPDGESKLRLEFRQTNLEKVANILSISGMLGLLAVIIVGRRTYE